MTEAGRNESEARNNARGRSRANRLVFAALALIAVAAAGWYFTRSHGAAEPGASGSLERASAGSAAAGASNAAGAGIRPALTITIARPESARWAVTLDANGSIAAWQEASISAEVAGLRIAQVQANVGDRVERGQVLATLAPSTVANDLAAQQATLVETQAALAEASANAERARRLQDSGAISAQLIGQYLTAERTARARLQATEARIRTEKTRLAQTEVRAQDDGIVSSRSATVGAVAQTGQELFRLIRQGRLEWRAEVPASDLWRVNAGDAARIAMPDGSGIDGTVRTVAPTIDPLTRNGLVYVDLGQPVGVAAPGRAAPRAGMFARGSFRLGTKQALTVPAQAVMVRDGFSHVFKLGAQDRVLLSRVVTGRREGERIEIVEGVTLEDRIAASGIGFLADGDRVSIVTDAPVVTDPAAGKGTRPGAPRT